MSQLPAGLVIDQWLSCVVGTKFQKENEYEEQKSVMSSC